MNNNEIMLGVLIIDPLNGKTGEHALKEGEKVISSNDEVFNTFTPDEVKQICEEHGCFYKRPPVTVTYLLPEQQKTVLAQESKSVTFESLDSIKNFLKENQGLAVCGIIERTDEKIFLLRYYEGIRYKNSLQEKLDSNFNDFEFIFKTIKEQFGAKKSLDIKDSLHTVLREELLKII